MKLNREQTMRLFALLVLVFVSALSTARAATIPAGVDLVFLVDQSGSMMAAGAAKASRTANDKYGKRIEAIKRLDAHLLQSAVAGYVNRISVIEFGGRHRHLYRSAQSVVQVTLKRKEIPAVPPGQKSSHTFKLIQQALSPIKVVFRGDTDIANAMSLAQDELDFFQANPPVLGPGAKAGERKRLVMLITDGKPSAKGVKESHMLAEIEAWTGRITRDADLARFLVFGFSDSSSNYWERKWGAFWRGVASRDTQSPEGLAFLIGRDEDAVLKIGEVLSELIPPAVTTAGEDTYTAPAYLKSLNFTIDYSKPYLPVGEIKILDPSGNLLQLSDAGEQSAAILLNDPPPGQYRLRSANAPYRVQVLPVYEAAKLAAPTYSVKQYGDETIRYRLDGRGPGGRFAPQSNLPAVRFDAVMRTPNGVDRHIPMIYDQGSGDVVSQTPVRFDTPGDYRLDFTGKTKAPDGTESRVYRSEDNLKVDRATPVEAYFVAPTVGEGLVLWQGAVDVPVEVRFRHAHTGADLAVSQVLNSGDWLGIGYFASADDDRPIAPVELAASGAGLAAILPIDFGRTRWDLLWQGTRIRLLLSPSVSDPWRSGMRYIGVVGSGDYWAGPEVGVKESPWVLWIWGLALVALIVAMVLIWLLLLVRWLIERGDRKYQRAPKLSYTVARDPDQCSKEWPLKGIRILSEPRLVTLADGGTWTIDKFRIKRLRRPGNKVAVEVRYRPKDAPKGIVKKKLEATNDNANPKARHQIVGLPDGQAADFVLFMNKTEEGR